MKIFSHKKAGLLKQRISLLLAAIILIDAIYPSVAMALTSGPASPEFSSFEPIATTNMVNEFSGDFTYNIPVIDIPGANGGGYAMSLSYHSGESAESEASWVGYGWTLNPGVINRNKKGYADDTKNKRVYYNQVPDNWTVSGSPNLGLMEAFSFNLPLSASSSIRYNNYRGFGYTAGAGISFRQGLVTLGYSVSDGNGSFSAQVNPGVLLSKDKTRKEANSLEQASYNPKTGAKTSGKQQNERKNVIKPSKWEKRIGVLSGISSNYGMYLLGNQEHATTVSQYKGNSYNANFNLQMNLPPVEIGAQIGFSGNYNIQKNESPVTRTAYGYLHSYDAYNDPTGSMDYMLEKEAMYNKRDRYLSIPHSNADGFSVSGEGLGGGFRLHSSSAGHFRPNATQSKTTISQIAADINIGAMIGGGVNLGLGQQTLDVNGDVWDEGGNTWIFNFSSLDYDYGAVDEPFFFRYNGDLGGEVTYDDYNMSYGKIIPNRTIPGGKSFHVNIDNANSFVDSKIMTNGSVVKRSGRSSYIGYHLNKEMNQPAYPYEKSNTIVFDAASNGYSPIDRISNPDQIGEITTVNEEGNRYVYGLPVLVKDETSLQYDVTGGSVYNNFIAKKDLSNYKRKIGEQDFGTYASSYLLTQITTPDYVDRTFDGPTPDDLGGYTKFEYERVYSVAGNGYHYRMPYSGLQYSKGEICDATDDMGAYTSGYKDVYYLKKIITKTHTAVFSTSQRLDGLEADSDLSAAAALNARGNVKRLRKLDAISLYTNETVAGQGKLVKKVCFKYDNSLCKNLPNNTLNSTYNLPLPTTAVANSGKLTLTRVWFEYEGIVNSKISPYEFSYEYPKSTVVYPGAYDARFKAGYTGLTENPLYSPFAVDAWGNYQDGTTAEARYANLASMVNQNPPATFDPAAWQLKVIRLPSGGEIHVQYEQDDYLYVQNRRAMALVSLLTPTPVNAGQQTYILNTADIGVTTTLEKQALTDSINRILTGEKIYFKFLYSLIGNNAPGINDCSSDYISGYVNFVSAQVQSGNVTVTVGSSGSYALPKDVCLDRVKKQKGGKLSEAGNCDPSVNAGISNEGSVKQMVKALINKSKTSIFPALSCCKAIKADLSYFKIPVLKPKKGGGIRVKRLLMYDANGIDYGTTSLTDGTAAVYGTEYFYQTENGASSGVATNEPAGAREENPLVGILVKRRDQNLGEKIFAGVDREEFEGPLGENLLPQASVGYSRVVSKNIHSGKTNNGFIVSEFYTAQNYPYDMAYKLGINGVDYTTIEKKSDWMQIPAVIFNYSLSNIWAAQGYRFVVNNMHGQPKSVATYAGNYTSGTSGALTAYAKSSSTEYEYFQPGEYVKVALSPDASSGSEQMLNIGSEEELIFEMKQVSDVTADANVEIDFGVGIAGFIPLPQASASVSSNYTESKMYTHVTSKVLYYPAIQKSITVSQNGIYHKTENDVFSAYTGKPVKTITTDGYQGFTGLPAGGSPHDGTYTTYEIPAFSKYKEMGQKAINERYILKSGIQNLTDISVTHSPVGSPNYYLLFTSTNPTAVSVCNAMELFSRGDLIRVNDGSNAYFNVDEIAGSKLYLIESSFNKYPNGNGITSIPSPPTPAGDKIEIIRSGRTNQLNTLVGAYTTYGNSLKSSTIPDPTVKTQWDAFITALNNAVASGGGSINYTNFPYVVNNDANCSPLSGNILVSGVVNNVVSVTVPNASIGPNLIKNGDFSNVNTSCMTTNYKGNGPFINGCVNNWIQSHGLPLIDNPDNYARLLIFNGDGQPFQSGIIQTIPGLDITKNYVLSFSARYNNAATAKISAGFVHPSFSPFPMGDSATGYSSFPPVLVPLSGAVNKTFTPLNNPNFIRYTSSSFLLPSTNHIQFYIYAEMLTNGANGVVDIDNISLTQSAGNCVTQLVANGGGNFAYDESGQIMFYSKDNTCNPQPLNCFKFCGNNAVYTKVSNVINCAASVLDLNWPLGFGASAGRDGNPYETGEKGKWRLRDTYAYNETIKGGSAASTNERNYNDAGVYDMLLFKWKNPAINNAAKWIRMNTVTQYSVDGEGQEEYDALGLYSAAKYGYNRMLPYMVGKNSEYQALAFESFEKIYKLGPYYYFEDVTDAVQSRHILNLAHAGKACYSVGSNAANDFKLKGFLVTDKVHASGMSLKVWVKDITYAEMPIRGNLQNNSAFGSSYILEFNKIAQTGEWSLYEAINKELTIGAQYQYKLYSNTTGNIYIDDVRQQPLNAQTTAYVYDPITLKLVTSFDDQHFGLYYQYNAEGKLVRKLMETRKGMKTIAETQYNAPTKVR